MKIFTKHPESVGETYLQHLLYASCSGFKMITGGLACILHGIFPFWCEKNGQHYVIKPGAETC